MAAARLLFEGAEVYISELETAECPASAARIETMEGPKATVVLLTPWQGTELSPGQLVLVGLAAESSFLQTKAKIKEFHPPARIRLKLLGPLKPTDRREFLRVSDYISLGYSMLSPQDYPIARLKVLKRKRMLIRRDIGSATREFIPNMPEEIDYLAKKMDAIDAKLDYILSLLNTTKADASYAKGGKRLRWVNLSGSGLRFSGDLKVKKGTLVEVEIDLPLEPPVEVKVICRVLGVNEDKTGKLGEDKYLISARFEVVHERERDDIIKYTFKRQRELLREQRRHNRPD
ncbi:MAG: PilZ domain-containing protein [Deltaproteobacteria bacterium]|nr:PilZ domain-containing protein [Deltaproteobacteria bacterium]